MQSKTIKLKKDEYTNFTNEFDENDIIILTGARGSGKSYPVAKYIKQVLINDETAKFIYMRNRDVELSTYESWCIDLDLLEVINAHCINDICETVKIKRGNPTKGDITIKGYNIDEKLIYERIIGKCISLESSSVYKSGKYDDFKVVVFEEYVYLNIVNVRERKFVFNFLENITSIFRNREKKIFLLSNRLKNIPLLETTVDELEGEIFKNPCKYKIFREQTKNSKTNEFLAYLNGELYEDDDFKVIVEEFKTVYITRDFIIMKHRIYNDKYYIQGNNDNKKMVYTENSFLYLYEFVRMASNNEFYYQNFKIENTFIKEYRNILADIQYFTATKGMKYIENV